MANTYTLIASSTVGSGGAASIDFTSIPSTYTDLVIKGSARDNTSAGDAEFLQLQFNGSTSSLSSRWIRGNGTNATSSNSATVLEAGLSNGPTMTANTFTNYEFYIPNYTGSNNKSVSADMVLENNATFGYMALSAGLWSNTAAITSIKLLVEGGGSFVQYTTAYLYGIKNS